MEPNATNFQSAMNTPQATTVQFKRESTWDKIVRFHQQGRVYTNDPKFAYNKD